jgi:large subunit ribosomal protein L3
MKTLIGRKMGMTQVFAEDGTTYPVTVIEVLPNTITAIKTKEKDGYVAVQIGYQDVEEKRLSKPALGVYKKINVAAKKRLGELFYTDINGFKVGDNLDVTQFKNGDVVDVIGTSKGKGYSGTVKRYHNTISPKSHGASWPHRGAGSMATVGRTNNRIHPGKHMAGHHGKKQATILNLLVVGVDKAKNALLVRGGIPGPNLGYVVVRTAIKTQLGKALVSKPLINRQATAK